MNTERLYKILDSQISKKSVNKDFNINIGLSNTNKPLPLNQIDSVVDQSQVFEDERNVSNLYRFLGSIRPLISNVLFDITGPDSLQTINSIISLSDEQFSQVNQLLIEQNGWFGYFVQNGNNLCEFVDLYPKKKDLLIVKDGVKDNWSLKITYPYTGLSNTVYFNANNDPLRPIYLSDGIAISSVYQTKVGDVDMTGFKIPISHGLNVGDEVKITGGTLYDGIHTVILLGDNVNNEFIINTFITGSTSGITFTNASMKRVVNNVESKYYARYFSAITQTNEIDFYPTAFSTTIFGDEVIGFNTNNNIDISLYRDYLDRPITEVYLTMVKTKTSSNYWGNLKVGLETKVDLVNYDIKQINDQPYPLPDLGIISSTNNVFFGDIIDYNDENISEIILEGARHRFNSNNRNTNSYYEGYYYKPHYKIVTQYYSSQVEYSDPNIPTINIPDYALFSNGRYRWRDILTKGYFDETNRGVNYPFLNGVTYIHENYFLSLKRQDPTLSYDHGTSSINGATCSSTQQFTINDNDVC
jgi:hypothetical protein